MLFFSDIAIALLYFFLLLLLKLSLLIFSALLLVKFLCFFPAFFFYSCCFFAPKGDIYKISFTFRYRLQKRKPNKKQYRKEDMNPCSKPIQKWQILQSWKSDNQIGKDREKSNTAFAILEKEHFYGEYKLFNFFGRGANNIFVDFL